VTILLGRVLRTGATLAASIVIVGGTVYLWNRGALPADYRIFRSEPADLRSIHGILVEAAAGNGRGLIQLGLLALIATPVARVLCSVVGFARERDWMYVTITFVVLMLLGYSLIAG
jgi:uncharacterized membrane protein